ncbi:type VI secretion system membrane subunit TssM [Pollutimonas harenae]|uniref:Type VI secretion system membrane subunit TssM n=1 Tax=Pollutimonas harenae TaxID=657015 RepID=A0A853H5N7_9BURK|nr:type VI secretion system membrane subunit TssM [Pollutimonas harenae]NYT86485.1 type VI secretion system membrane subunit TssM [Pollutimonas harenae]TEA69770.1 type VI secretion system membrane subunit TssM [Pollutimonas harenae]
MSSLFSFLLSRGLWSFFGLLALALLIWVAGPLLAFGAVRPLESETVRITVIVAMFALYVLRLLWRKWREGRLNAQLLGQLRRPAKKVAAEEPGQSPEVKALSERFDEAIELLHKMRFDGKSSRLPLARFSRQHLYQLPWYVFIGAPGSGKTTALVNSGLNFPLADRFGKVALRGVGGTRNCDWWFTDDAVLLDTAGRYTTQESDPTGDEEEWKGFLKLLIRYRGRQPVNGVMLTVSIEDLLSSSDTERVQHAAVLRQRLQELREQLGIQFPVYVLVTKSDLMSGFNEYFSSCSREALKQVWGFTFPYARLQAEGFNLQESFNAEYDLLKQRLYAGLPDVMSAEPDESRRALAYLLPQQFAGLQPILGHFLSDVFATSRFESSLLPRGVYFTSGTQGGRTFDHVTGQLKRYLKIDGLSSVSSAAGGSANGNGRSYFLQNLLQKVIFSESGLAGRNMKWERRYRRLQWGGYAAVGACLLLLLIGWANSYRNNSQYLKTVQGRIPEVEALGREIKLDASGDVLGLLPYLDALQALPAGNGFETDDPPFSYGFGLYQGDKIQAAADGAYRVAQDQVLVPQVSQRIATALRAAPADDLEYSYEALRAYLMLYDAQRYNPDFMHTWLLSNMRTLLAEGYTRKQYGQLSGHLRRLVGSRVLTSPFAKDEALIARTRTSLDQHALSERAYSRLKRLLLNDQMPDTTFLDLGGPSAMSVFARVSGKPLNEGIPGLYSYKGYWERVDKQVGEVAANLRRDDRWVLGVDATQGEGAIPDEQLIADIRRLYLADYVRNWDMYLADLTLKPAQTLLQNIETARTLSSANSPLVQLIQSVARETTLLRDSESDERSLVDRAKDKVNSTQNSLERMFGSVVPGDPTRAVSSGERIEAMVDRHFSVYRNLSSAPQGGAAPIAATTDLINDLYVYLTASDAALRSASSLPTSSVVTQLQAEAGRLPKPVGGMLTQLSLHASNEVSDVERQQLGRVVSANLGVFCRQAIAGRYPFSSKSSRDVAPNDFARLFAPGAMMDDFFQKKLVNHVDMSGSRWRFKPGVDGEPGEKASYLDAFQRASIIRSVYFTATGTEPSYRVSIRPLHMDTDITQFIMNVDGQTVSYAHGPQVGTTVQWPGTRGSNQVSIELLPQVGVSGLSATGPWALNRLLDKASLKRGPSPEITIASFSIGGRKVVLELSANTVKSPFRLSEMQGFSCPGKG